MFCWKFFSFVTIFIAYRLFITWFLIFSIVNLWIYTAFYSYYVITHNTIAKISPSHYLPIKFIMFMKISAELWKLFWIRDRILIGSPDVIYHLFRYEQNAKEIHAHIKYFKHFNIFAPYIPMDGLKNFATNSW
jgi:hypothetical protein